MTVASVPLNAIVLALCVPSNCEPLIVTDAPGTPDPGVSPVIIGPQCVGFDSSATAGLPLKSPVPPATRIVVSSRWVAVRP